MGQASLSALREKPLQIVYPKLGRLSTDHAYGGSESGTRKSGHLLCGYLHFAKILL